MSIVYYGNNYSITDLQKWHLWFPWVPVRLTEGGWFDVDGGWMRGVGRWRWLYAVERRISNPQVDDMNDWIWEYRDIGNRVDDPMFRGSGDGLFVAA